MGRIDEIQMMRVTDDTDTTLVCTCVPRSSRGHVRMGSPEQWSQGPQVTCVAVDTSGLLQISDPSTLAAIGAWFGAASVWLKTQQMREDLEDSEQDDEWDDEEGKA